jgi:hypothetical protein
VSNAFLAGRSAVRWTDWDVQREFFGEQLPFDWSFCGRMGGMGRLESVLW